MGIISAILFGFVAGILAKLFMPGRDPGGFIVTTLLGMAGAFVGKYVSTLFGGSGDLTRWSMTGFFFSIAGAMLLLLLYRLMMRGRTRTV